MQTIDGDEELETIHLYVVREEAARPSMLPVFLALVTLSVLLVLCTLSPASQPEERRAIRIPAVFLLVKSFTTSVPIIPTGIQTYPATNAQGVLTLTNGSVVSQELPQGLIFTSSGGIEVVTLSSVFVPAGSATGYGFATVEAKAVGSGSAGNIPALWGKATVGGTMEGKLSLHDPATNRRLTQSAQVMDCKPVKVLRWRTHLVPLVRSSISAENAVCNCGMTLRSS